MITLTTGVMTTTAQKLHGRPVREYLGVVSGEAVISVQPPRHSRGGHVSLQHARRRALQTLANRASAQGATVVIGIDLDYVPLGSDSLLVSATGTAVRL
jgi:uncharacterized protein YbjQ (UPF0145 family)